MLKCFSLELLMAVLANQAIAADRLATFTVKAGPFERVDVPVSVAVDGIPQDQANLRLEELLGGDKRTAVACQVEVGDPATVYWILSGTTPPNTERTFELLQAAPDPAQNIEVQDDGKAVTVSRQGVKILQYNTLPVKPPEGVAAEYERGSYVHPVWSPSGIMLTDDFPPDHLHHKGLWAAWTHTVFEGRTPDFWNIGAKTGTVRHKAVLAKGGGPVFAEVSTEQDYVDLLTPEPKVVLTETWDVKVWNVGGPDKKYWLFDLTSTQRLSTTSPLSLPAYRYGGVGWRGAREWDGPNCNFLTSEGKTRIEGHGTRARWCEMNGKVKDGVAGVLIMGNPQNFRFPEYMRIHPTEPFFNFLPMQQEDWTLEPGQDYVFRYRYCAHEGAMGAEEAEKMWRDYGEPVDVKVKKG